MPPLTATRPEVDSAETDLFNDLIRPLLSSGFGLACAMLRDREAAEDALQEAAIKAWRNARKAARPGYSPRPWFLAIVANQCRDTRRTSWWRVLKLADLPEQTRSDYTERVEDQLDLDRALARLSREQRALLFLRYRLDMPPSAAPCRRQVTTPQGPSQAAGRNDQIHPGETR